MRLAVLLVCLVPVVAGCRGSSDFERGAPAKACESAGRIVFSSDPLGDIYTSRADGSRVRPLIRAPGPQLDADWSPDGRRIAYRDSRAGINRNDEIYVADADGSHRRNLTHDPANEWSPAWSPDGRQIAFTSSRAGARLNLWAMNADGSHARRLTDGIDEYPRWSPDGRHIAYAGALAATRDIWVVDRDGGHPHRLTRTLDEDMAPAWSPDGKLIAFERGFEPRRDIWVMRSDGSGAHAIKRSRADETFPVWSPDGTQILYSRDFNLRVMRADGSHDRSLGIAGGMADWTIRPLTRATRKCLPELSMRLVFKYAMYLFLADRPNDPR